MMETVIANQAAKSTGKEVAKRGLTIGMKEFAKRLGMNYRISPKGPGPYMVALTVCLCLLSAQQAYAETTSMQSDLSMYQAYLEKYHLFIARRAEQGDMQRAGHIPRPLKFEEWRKSGKAVFAN